MAKWAPSTSTRCSSSRSSMGKKMKPSPDKFDRRRWHRRVSSSPFLGRENALRTLRGRSHRRVRGAAVEDRAMGRSSDRPVSSPKVILYGDPTPRGLCGSVSRSSLPMRSAWASRVCYGSQPTRSPLTMDSLMMISLEGLPMNSERSSRASSSNPPSRESNLVRCVRSCFITRTSCWR